MQVLLILLSLWMLLGKLCEKIRICGPYRNPVLKIHRHRNFFAAWHDFANNEWSPKMGKVYAETPEPWERIVPAWASIKDIPDTLPW